jgi:Dolichyl-phosphate-mannose-protein mannosyltransferase
MKHFRFTKTSCLLFPLIFFIVISLFYCFATPLWVPPDEDRHYVYCDYIARNSKLPFLDPEDEGFKVAQAIHPPLYYIVASFLCPRTQESVQKNFIIDENPGYGIVKLAPAGEADSLSDIVCSAYLLRFLSIFFSAIAIYCVYRIVLIIFPGEYCAALAAAVFVAANPQFIHISASVSNDPMANAFSAFYLLTLIVFSRKKFGYQHQVIAGFILGCCLLIKTSAIIYIPVTFIALALAFPKNMIGVFRKFLFIIFVAVCVSGWWYFRNLIVYNDPVFSNALNTMQPWSLRTTPVSLDYLLLVFKMSFVSFFGFFGAMQVPLSTLHLGFYGVLVAGAGVGCMLHLCGKNLSSEQIRILSILVCALLCGLILYCSFNITYTMFMGRYLYVVIVPIAVCFSVGLRILFPPPWRTFLMLAVSFLFALACLDVYARIVNPSFSDRGLQPGIEQKEFCCVTPPITNAVTIQQTFVSPQDNLCAIRVMFARDVKLTKGVIRFVLTYAGDDQETIARITLPVKIIDDFSKILFVFAPVANSQGKQFAFILDTPDLSNQEYPALIYEKESALEDGFLCFNNQQQNGALFFTTFHLPSNSQPDTRLGRTASFINEGWYVSIRELQLYGEFPKESMLWKQTSQKIHRVEKMLLNRAQR